jgi:hypothetical protein
VILVVLLHLLRALAFLTAAIIMSAEFIVPLMMGLVELVVAYWIWSLRMDAWGLSLGVALLHLLYPSLWTVSPLGSLLISASTVIQILALFAVRKDGGFNFNQIYSVDTQETRTAGSIQNRMLQLVVVTQTMKAVAMLFAGVMFLTLETISPFPPWLGLIPVGPFALGLAVLDLAAAVQLHAGAE